MNKDHSLEIKLKKQDKVDKDWYNFCIEKHNIGLERFNFLDKDFQEKFNDYKQRLRNYFYNEDSPNKTKNGYFANSYADDLIGYYSMTQHQYPEFLRRFLSDFAKTKFYKKYYDEYKEAYDGFEDYCYVNWQTAGSKLNSDFDDINNIFQYYGTFGEIPHYEYDKLCAICINFETCEAEVVRGWSVGPYASKVLKKYSPVPKYMKPIVDKLFEDYKTWRKESNYDKHE